MVHVACLVLTPNTDGGRPSVTSYAYGLYTAAFGEIKRFFVINNTNNNDNKNNDNTNIDGTNNNNNKKCHLYNAVQLWSTALHYDLYPNSCRAATHAGAQRHLKV